MELQVVFVVNNLRKTPFTLHLSTLKTYSIISLVFCSEGTGMEMSFN